MMFFIIAGSIFVMQPSRVILQLGLCAESQNFPEVGWILWKEIV